MSGNGLIALGFLLFIGVAIYIARSIGHGDPADADPVKSIDVAPTDRPVAINTAGELEQVRVDGPQLIQGYSQSVPGLRFSQVFWACVLAQLFLGTIAWFLWMIATQLR